jgi:hypothetical protein
MKTPAQNKGNDSATGAPVVPGGVASSGPSEAVSLPLVWRLSFSVLLVVHLLAVLAGPWSFAPLRSDLAGLCYASLKPYVEVLGLNNGYRFFAPEPGPSHLIRYDLEMPDGTHQGGVFPDLANEQPRLRYHRHFMLSEFLNSLDVPGGRTELAEAYAESYAMHLKHQYQAAHVTLYMRRHRLPTMAEVRGGARLDDEKFYEEKLIVTDKDEE